MRRCTTPTSPFVLDPVVFASGLWTMGTGARNIHLYISLRDPSFSNSNILLIDNVRLGDTLEEEIFMIQIMYLLLVGIWGLKNGLYSKPNVLAKISKLFKLGNCASLRNLSRSLRNRVSRKVLLFLQISLVLLFLSQILLSRICVVIAPYKNTMLL